MTIRTPRNQPPNPRTIAYSDRNVALGLGAEPSSVVNAASHPQQGDDHDPSHDLGLRPGLGRPLSWLSRGAERRSLSPRSLPLSPTWRQPPRCLLVPPVRMIRPRASVPTRSPSGLPGLHVFSPSTKAASPWLQARRGTRWGVIGDSDPSGSARQLKKSRRSTGSPRAGSEGDGKLATGGRLGQTSRDPRRHRRDRQRRELDERTDGPEPGHLMARRARRRREAGRALGWRADRTARSQVSPADDREGCPRRMPMGEHGRRLRKRARRREGR